MTLLAVLLLACGPDNFGAEARKLTFADQVQASSLFG
jgi:hypothetical protein